jgi:hypothetical protein
MNFIQKLDFKIDSIQLRNDLNQVLTQFPWDERNQIGLKYRANASNLWTDSIGSLYDKESQRFISTESDFTEINPYIPSYTKLILEELSEKEKVNFGRIRYMRLMPKTGLSIHHDYEKRYHFVLKTNPHSLFGKYNGTTGLAAECYHIPDDGNCYMVDTTVPHFVYNGGGEPRIHLVICRLENT